MKEESRQRVALKVGAVFITGLLLFVVQFGADGLWDLLLMFTMPLAMWNVFTRDGFWTIWFSLGILMLTSIGVCIWSKRLLWISYILIVAFWLWTYSLMTLLI